MAPSNAARRKQSVHPFYGPGAQQLRLCFAQWGTCYSQLSLKDLFSVIFLLNDTIQADLANFSAMIHSLQTKKRFSATSCFYDGGTYLEKFANFAYVFRSLYLINFVRVDYSYRFLCGCYTGSPLLLT